MAGLRGAKPTGADPRHPAYLTRSPKDDAGKIRKPSLGGRLTGRRGGRSMIASMLGTT